MTLTRPRPASTAAPAPPPPPRRALTVPVAAVLVLALAASVAVAVAIGSADIAPGDVVATVWAHLTGSPGPLSATRDAIVWELRMPRVLTAAAVGGGLAVCGAVMQSLTRNPLADPYLLGLSSGASTGAVIVIVLGVALALPVAAFAGAFVALLLTLGLARAAGSVSSTAVILAGLAVSAVLSALTSLVIFWSATGDSYREILGWLLGMVAGATWADAGLAFAAVLLCGIPLLASSRLLDGLALGDSAALALGVPVGRLRLALFAVTALLTGVLVAVSGSIGFVGLILPHAVRAIVGLRHRAVLPVSFLAGATFLVWADTAARTLFDPRELPVGILTALIGGPLFAVILLRRRATMS
ncbi:putative F420-0 ABC transporter permease subunit [Microbacterium sp. No. 7]|uniref:putative F420-0 ABC transporter permease subunit n=1 Tax=Microbacterium sp. No. 7 TaxID=1714373 RepID=UPI0006ED0123|nr:putative F420-0 ABC transporter permease subunit [Microbacterium sp. No. 7]ALJ18810.1 iron ABC transporter permease [Microbacterium sp. No. 7]